MSDGPEPTSPYVEERPMPDYLELPPKRTWRSWLPGVLLALAAGVGLPLLAKALHLGYGFGFVIGIPVAVGLIFGSLVRTQQAVTIGGALAIIVGFVAMAVIGDISGILCGVIVGVIFLLPLLLGVWIAVELFSDGGATPNRHDYLRSLCIAVLPIGSMFLESTLPNDFPVETVETAVVIEAPLERAWRSLVFYEEVTHEPPLLARIGLPMPVRTEGDIQAVGDIKTCIYSTGHLRKKVTGFEPERRLAFDVIEQQGIEDESMELLTGSFSFEAVSEGRTRVTLVTTYRPLLSARPVWRPFEHRLARTLHEHVLEGIALRAAGSTPVDTNRLATR